MNMNKKKQLHSHLLLNIFYIKSKQYQSLMKNMTRIITLFFLLHSTLCFAQVSGTTMVQQYIQEQMEALQDSNQRILNESLGLSERIHRPKVDLDFYQKRSFMPAWTNGTKVLPAAKQLLNCLQTSASHGLLPQDYHLTELTQMIGLVESSIPEQLHLSTVASLDILLSDAYILLGTHYLEGKIEPTKHNPNWSISKKAIGMAFYLEKAITDNTDICASLDALAPVHPEYQQLREILQIYQSLYWQPIQADWNILLQKGSRSPLVLNLRERLKITGDLAPDAEQTDFFDKDLEKAVMKFQRRHGMFYDGLVRSNVVNALNVTVDERIQQIKANLERWRWMPDNLGTAHIAINIPEYILEMWDNGRRVYRDLVVVGRERYQTASFSDSIEYLVLNPYWNMPKSIAKNELSFAVQDDIEHFANQDIHVFKNNKEVDPKTIDWFTADYDKYFFRQHSNSENPMGLVKFIFPNEFDIYMHDTPTKNIFNYSRRSHSHGCVRLNEPMKYAQFLLDNYNTSWDSLRVKRALANQDDETIVRFPKPIPIHLMYWTVFIDEDTGELNFREDLYLWDRDLSKLLAEPLN